MNEVKGIVEKTTSKRSYISVAKQAKVSLLANTLKAFVDRYGMIDVGKNAAEILDVPATTLVQAVQQLEGAGYRRFYIAIKQSGATGKSSTEVTVKPRAGSIKVLTKPGYTFRMVFEDRQHIKSIAEILKEAPKERTRIIHDRMLRTNKTLHVLNSQTLRIRELKRDGMSNVAIGRMVGVHESTVRRRLKAPLTKEELLLESMQESLMIARDDILCKLKENPLLAEIFPRGEYGEEWVFSVHTVKRRATMTPNSRVTFNLEFSAMAKNLEE